MIIVIFLGEIENKHKIILKFRLLFIYYYILSVTQQIILLLLFLLFFFTYTKLAND